MLEIEELLASRINVSFLMMLVWLATNYAKSTLDLGSNLIVYSRFWKTVLFICRYLNEALVQRAVIIIDMS